MNGNLIPTVISDKNGKITTVYKKPSNFSQLPSVIPTPKVATTAPIDRAKAIDAIAEAVHKNFNFDDDSRDPKVRENLNQYPDELLNRLTNYFNTYSHGHYFTASAIDDGAEPLFVSEMMTYSPYFRTDSKGLAEAYVRSLHHCKQLPSMEDYGTASEEVQIQCRALLTVIEEIDYSQYYEPNDTLPLEYVLGNPNPSKGHARLQGDDLIKLVLERTEHAERIAEIIIERKTGDTDLIKEILSQDDSKALNSGVL